MNDLIHLKAHRRPKATTSKFLLHRLQDVISLIFIKVEVLISGHTEEKVIFECDAGEELREMLGNKFIDEHEADLGLIRGANKAGKIGGDLYACKANVLIFTGFDIDTDIK